MRKEGSSAPEKEKAPPASCRSCSSNQESPGSLTENTLKNLDAPRKKPETLAKQTIEAGQARDLGGRDGGPSLSIAGPGASESEGEEGCCPHLVLKPDHALGPELVLEEVGAELGGEERDVLDDGEPHAPVAVLCELLDGGQEALGQQVDADDLVDLILGFGFRATGQQQPKTQD